MRYARASLVPRPIRVGLGTRLCTSLSEYVQVQDMEQLLSSECDCMTTAQCQATELHQKYVPTQA